MSPIRGAVAGCEYVLHVASPLPSKLPKNEDELIAPAREGALRVLRASRDAGVKRVVLTSSFAAIGYGQTLLLFRLSVRADPLEAGAWLKTSSNTVALALNLVTLPRHCLFMVNRRAA